MNEPRQSVGVVVIGRNEGERLRACLASLSGRVDRIVYVDSGSSDGSQALAAGFGADVIVLPADQPFTAARARNAGFERLAASGAPEFVQFVDGDCRVQEGWIERAAAALRAREDLGAVCGRRREIYPEASVYNRLCDLEWDTPIGEARACGGDAMMRSDAFEQVGGFDGAIIAGEEPELCVRLRGRGWKIERLEAEMTLHDAAMTRFSQWWRRTVRAGHAYAEGAARHGARPERHCVRDVRSIVLWGGILPMMALASAWPSHGWSLIALVLVLLIQGWRIARGQRLRGRTPADARVYAMFTVLGKIPQLIGVMTFWANRARGRKTALIEYKSAAEKQAMSGPRTVEAGSPAA